MLHLSMREFCSDNRSQLSIKIEPKNERAYNNRGNAYLQKGELDRSIADYDQAIKLSPKSADAYGNRGLAYEKKKAVIDAVADFRKTLELRPGDSVGTAGLKQLGILH